MDQRKSWKGAWAEGGGELEPHIEEVALALTEPGALGSILSISLQRFIDGAAFNSGLRTSIKAIFIVSGKASTTKNSPQATLIGCFSLK